MTPTKQDRIATVSNILRKYHLRAELDFDRMAIEIDDIYNVTGFTKDKNDEKIILDLRRRNAALSQQLHDNPAHSEKLR